jgi:uncharacterized protein (DUF58 family)
VAAAWKRLRGWRRIRFTAGGVVFTVGACAVGFAAVNTGNNLLHLLLGAMLGLIGVSGWFSERTIRHLEIRREVPRAVTAGQEVRIQYEVVSRGRLPALAVELSEGELAEKAFLPRVEPGEPVLARAYHRFPRRGVYRLESVTISTAFPFGLFVKERDLRLPAELVVWPRSDLPVRLPPPAGRPRWGPARVAAAAAGMRGDYRALHEYRHGEDARDIHWRTSARLPTPVVREYEAEVQEALWISLDTRGLPGDAAEALVETAASLAARAAREGRPFGLLVDGTRLPTASGPGHLELALDLLARVGFRPDARPPADPPSTAASVRLTLMAPGARRPGAPPSTPAVA